MHISNSLIPPPILLQSANQQIQASTLNITCSLRNKPTPFSAQHQNGQSLGCHTMFWPRLSLSCLSIIQLKTSCKWHFTALLFVNVSFNVTKIKDSQSQLPKLNITCSLHSQISLLSRIALYPGEFSSGSTCFSFRYSPSYDFVIHFRTSHNSLFHCRLMHQRQFLNHQVSDPPRQIPTWISPVRFVGERPPYLLVWTQAELSGSRICSYPDRTSTQLLISEALPLSYVSFFDLPNSQPAQLSPLLNFPDLFNLFFLFSFTLFNFTLCKILFFSRYHSSSLPQPDISSAALLPSLNNV